MNGLTIVNTQSGARVRPVRSRVAAWSAPDDQGLPQVRYNAKPGMNCGDERVVEIVETMTGEGTATRTMSEAWDGADQWVIAKERYTPDPQPVSEATMIERIRTEAERRIFEGVEIGGVRFRCDGRSLTRIQAFAAMALRLEAAAQAVDITFTTDAGETVTLTSAAAAEQICDAVTDHVGTVLKQSNALQVAQAEMTGAERATYDETADAKWAGSE